MRQQQQQQAGKTKQTTFFFCAFASFFDLQSTVIVVLSLLVSSYVCVCLARTNWGLFVSFYEKLNFIYSYITLFLFY